MNTKDSFRTPFYPLTPILFLIFNTWLLYFGFTQKPLESMIGVATVLLGLVVYFVGRNKTTES